MQQVNTRPAPIARPYNVSPINTNPTNLSSSIALRKPWEDGKQLYLSRVPCLDCIPLICIKLLKNTTKTRFVFLIAHLNIQYTVVQHPI